MFGRKKTKVDKLKRKIIPLGWYLAAFITVGKNREVKITQRARKLIFRLGYYEALAYVAERKWKFEEAVNSFELHSPEVEDRKAFYKDLHREVINHGNKLNY